MLKQSSKLTGKKIKLLLANVGDMALKRRAKTILENLDLKPTDKVLEVGCGNGYYLSLLSRLNITSNLTGVDVDKYALMDAKKFINNKKVKLVLTAGEKLPFSSKAFDKIIMSEVIEHVKDEKKVLQEVYRVLKPDGELFLTTCNIDYPFLWDPVNWLLQHVFNTHIKSGFWAGIWNQHERLYTEEGIEKLVKNVGFKIEKSEVLTRWCLPFNHYIVNFIAKLFYSNKLPTNLSRGMNKFQNNKQPFLVKFSFGLINLIDKLNDCLPQKNGVSIFLKARK